MILTIAKTIPSINVTRANIFKGLQLYDSFFVLFVVTIVGLFMESIYTTTNTYQD